MTVRVEAVLIETTRLAELKDFYCNGFGLEQPDTVEEEQIGFQIGDVYFGLEQVEAGADASRTMSLWFKVDDARKVYEHLLTLGATSKQAPAEDDGEVIAAVLDPDGNAIGILSDL